MSLRLCLLRRLFILVLLAGYFAFPAAAQDGKQITRLAGRDIRMPANATAWLDSFSSKATSPALVLLQFNKIPDEGAIRRLEESGISLHSFLAPAAFVASIAPRRAYQQGAGIRSIVALEAGWKIAPVLTELVRNSAPVEALISFLPGTGEAEIAARLRDVGGILLTSGLSDHSYFEASLPGDQIIIFAKWPAVLSIGQAPRDVPLNLESERTTKVNVAKAPAAAGGYGLLGDSVTVGVGDISCGLYHVDTRDRVTNYNFLGYANHGQHVTGTVGGAGTLDPLAEGFAPHAKLINHYFNHVWERTGAMLSAHNMTVTNNSYAASGAPTVAAYCAYAGTYDGLSQALDSIALQYPTVMHVFAAGNEGTTNCPPFLPGYATIAGGYQAAKNILVVANARKFFPLNGGSSRGPLRDGRIKPDITAVGSNVYSCRGLDLYQSAIGTSMASPQVAGAAALLQQHYKRSHGGAYPPSVLTKTLLMDAALDLGPAGPDFGYGYGMMDLNRALKMLDNGWYTSGTIANAANQTPLTITVPSNTAQLKVMLCWNDAPASPLSAIQLVNDLDLKVTDPSSAVQLPYVLNPAPTHVADTATRAADHLNNTEQVVIDNPASGSYVVGVSGYSVPSGSQSYMIAYDLIPKGISISSPFKGEAYKANSSLEIYWTASADTNRFDIDYSTDNGASWIFINNVAARDREYAWVPAAGINSSQCLVRITRNVTGEQFTTGAFTINDQPVLSLLNNQCPGYVNLKWTSVPNATGYSVLRKVGYFLQPTATTTDTFFYASSLNPDSIYYFAVQPLFGAVRGFRSLGLSRKPDTGSCAGSYSDNELMAAKITAPFSGRSATSTALSASETLTVLIRNLDDAAAASYKVSYQINGGSWQSQTFSSLAANSTATVSFTGLNLSVPGTYSIRAAIENLSATDPVKTNDTVVSVLRQLANGAVTLTASGLLEDFESTPALTLLGDTVGFSTSGRWDFFNSNDTGRLRTYVDDEITISGSRSVSMDMQYQTVSPPSFNRLTGTFNLSSYNAASDEVRLEFDYKLHGHPKSPDSNKVWVRGSDTQPWTQLLSYNLSAAPGAVVHSGSLSVTDALVAASQSYGSSMQIAFGQRDTSAIATNRDGNGLTLDNVRLYLVTKDVGISAVTAPAAVNCALSASTPLTVTVFNGVTTSATGVGMHYQLDGGTVVNETLSSLAGKTSQSYTFTQTMNASTFGRHTVKVWAEITGDDCATNDTQYYSFRNEPLVSSFPYLQDFEANDGYWWTEGVQSSWAWGAPAGLNIKKAASGTRAWKTNLTGNYNDGELSYLYSPCFDISGLSSPMLSFSASMEIEDCGSTLCDGAWVEYSVAGGAWTKLGANGQGTNWYSSAAFQLWNVQTPVRWRVASIPLPAASQPVRFRFVFSSDPGANFDGIAIDDIHIFNRANAIYTGGAVGPVTQTVSGSGFTNFTSGSALLAQISPGSSSSLGATDVTLYSHSTISNPTSGQYFLPKNFVVNTQNAPSDSITARLYVTDADVLTLVNASGCGACTKPADAYELGITKYDNSNTSLENGSLSDNIGGAYEFIPYTRVRWVPYDAGYYAQFKVASFSELWFNNGGPGNVFPLPIIALDFDARKSGPNGVLITWLSRTDTQIMSYEVQRSSDARDWAKVAAVASVHDVTRRYSYTDEPGDDQKVRYYRLRYIARDGRAYFSPIRQIIWSGRASELQVYPNPTTDGKISVDWNTEPGTVLEAYISDITGRVVSRFSAAAADYNNSTSIDLGGLPKGVYVLHATLNGERFEIKVVQR